MEFGPLNRFGYAVAGGTLLGIGAAAVGRLEVAALGFGTASVALWWAMRRNRTNHGTEEYPHDREPDDDTRTHREREVEGLKGKMEG